MMKALSRILNYFYIVVVSIFQILVLIDTVYVVVDPTVYMFSSEGNWFERSSVNYICGNFLFVVLLGLFAYVGIKRLRLKGNKAWDLVYVVSVIVFFGAVLYGYLKWYLNGYDHL
jgi:hypothetical protein